MSEGFEAFCNEHGVCAICASRAITARCYSAAIVQGLQQFADAAQAAHHQRFFKTGPGEYGEGDVFLGARMPQVRAVVKEQRGLLDEQLHSGTALEHLHHLLRCRYHEVRVAAVLALVQLMEAAQRKEDAVQMRSVYDTYLASISGINNWDLVDVSAPGVTGAYLHFQACSEAAADPFPVLEEWTHSDNMWLQRVAVLSTFPFVRAGSFTPMLQVAVQLLDSPHDLIHKAVGWLLREVGKRDERTLLEFLRNNDHYKTMPRTMLRYAIERLDSKTRVLILNGKEF